MTKKTYDYVHKKLISHARSLLTKTHTTDTDTNQTYARRHYVIKFQVPNLLEIWIDNVGVDKHFLDYESL